MAEYIDRKVAIERLCDVYEYEFPTASGVFDEFATKIVPNVLKSIPAADVTPVVHGQWLNSKMLHPRQRICSICKNVVRQPSYDPNEYTLYPHCPYCTAKMDGGAE